MEEASKGCNHFHTGLACPCFVCRERRLRDRQLRPGRELALCHVPRFSELPDFSADALLQLRLVGDLHGLAVIVNLAVVELSLHFGDLLEAGRRSAPLDDLPGLCIVPEAAGFSGLECVEPIVLRVAVCYTEIADVTREKHVEAARLVPILVDVARACFKN